MKFLVSHFYTRFPLPTIISPHSLDSTRPWGDGDVCSPAASVQRLRLVGVGAGADAIRVHRAADSYRAARATVGPADAAGRTTTLDGGDAGHAVGDSDVAARRPVATANTRRPLAARGGDERLGRRCIGGVGLIDDVTLLGAGGERQHGREYQDNLLHTCF